jgi:hypothetical protein
VAAGRSNERRPTARQPQPKLAAQANPLRASLNVKLARQGPAAAPQESAATDVAKSLPSGAVRGASEYALLPSTIGQLALRGVSKLTGVGGGLADAWAASVNRARNFRDSQLHTPSTTPGKYADAIGEQLPGAVAIPEEGLAARALGAIRYGVIPGVASEAAGNLPGVKGTKLEAPARMIAGALGGSMGPAITNAPSRVTSPFQVPAARAARRYVEA